MRVVIDTNILLVSFSSRSQSHWLVEALENSAFKLYFTNEIMVEYEEMFSMHWNATMAQDVVRYLLELPNTYAIETFFRFNLVPFDKDDNKFVDCAVAANADFLVTNDKHFNILNEIPFPLIQIINLHNFEQLLRNQSLI